MNLPQNNLRMKKILLLTIAIIASTILVFTACEENSIPPTISIVAESGNYYHKDSTVSYSITASSHVKLETIDLQTYIEGVLENAKNIEVTEDYIQTFSFDFQIPQDAAVGDSIAIVVKVTDEKNETTTLKSFRVVAILPEIIITEIEGSTYYQGSQVEYSIELESVDPLQNLQITESFLDTAFITTIPLNSQTQLTIPYIYQIADTIAVGTSITLTFLVESSETETKKTLRFAVKRQPVNINTFTDITLGTQNNTTYGSFFASTNGTVYRQEQAIANSETIDLLYYYHAGNETNALCSPLDTLDNGDNYHNLASGFSTINTTSILKSGMSETTFDNIENDAIIDELNFFNQTRITNIAIGEILQFKTHSGKKGLLKVKSIDGTSSGLITFDVKIQQ